jgi:hypothetical protein
VTATHRVSIPVTEMWGRRAVVDDVRCHAEYVCDACGTIRDDGECLCDASKGDQCAIRQQFLATIVRTT